MPKTGLKVPCKRGGGRVKKLGIRSIQDFGQFAFGLTNEAGMEAQLLDRTQQNVYLSQTI